MILEMLSAKAERRRLFPSLVRVIYTGSFWSCDFFVSEYTCIYVIWIYNENKTTTSFLRSATILVTLFAAENEISKRLE